MNWLVNFLIFHAPTWKKVGGHFAFGLSVYVYVLFFCAFCIFWTVKASILKLYMDFLSHNVFLFELSSILELSPFEKIWLKSCLQDIS